MTPETFDALFDGFRETVFRLEALPSYAGGEGDVRAFLEGRPRQERSVRTSRWMARIAASTAAGKAWSRVRVVDDPLTDYERYELETYRESQAVGEGIRLVQRDRAGSLGEDFWLFDGDLPGAKAVLMHYSKDGRIESRELVDDPHQIESLSLRQTRNVAIAKSMPLNDFLAQQHVG